MHEMWPFPRQLGPRGSGATHQRNTISVHCSRYEQFSYSNKDEKEHGQNAKQQKTTQRLHSERRLTGKAHPHRATRPTATRQSITSTRTVYCQYYLTQKNTVRAFVPRTVHGTVRYMSAQLTVARAALRNDLQWKSGQRGQRRPGRTHHTPQTAVPCTEIRRRESRSRELRRTATGLSGSTRTDYYSTVRRAFACIQPYSRPP